MRPQHRRKGATTPHTYLPPISGYGLPPAVTHPYEGPQIGSNPIQAVIPPHTTPPGIPGPVTPG